MPSRCAFRVLHSFRFIRPKSDNGADAWGACIDRIARQQASVWPVRGLLSGITLDAAAARAAGRAKPRYEASDPVGPVDRTEEAITALLHERDEADQGGNVQFWELPGRPPAAPLHAFYRMELLHAAQQSLFGGHGSDSTYLRLSPEYLQQVLNDGDHQGIVPPAIAIRYWEELERGGCPVDEGGMPEPQPRHGMRGSFLSIFDAKRDKVEEPNAAPDPATPSAQRRQRMRAHRRLATCAPFAQRFCPAELWLSPYGVGVLSLNFDVTLPHDGAADLRHLVYSLSLPDAERSPWLVFGRVDAQVAIDARSLSRLAAHDRIGVPNQALRLTELRDAYLQSLTGAGLEIVADVEERRHLVYSVVRRLLPAAGGESPERLAIALAQTEEESHPGTPSGAESPVPCAWINAATFAAVSDQGAARVVLDQPADEGDDTPHEFNYERYQRNRDRSFVVYLAALQQRLVLERMRGSVASAVAACRTKPLHAVRTAVEKDHRDLLDFAISGMLAVVSTRDAYNRWYEMSREGNRVDRHYDALQQVMNSLDHSAQLEAQREENEHAAKSLSAIADIQESVRAENKNAAQSLSVIASIQTAAREAGDRGRFLEAMLVALSGVQFWFMLAERSNVNYWYAIGIGLAAYVASLWVAYGALGVSGPKRKYYAGAGFLMVVLAIVGRYVWPAPPTPAMPSPTVTSPAQPPAAAPLGSNGADPAAPVTGASKAPLPVDSARGADSAARGRPSARPALAPDSARPHR